MKQFKKLAGAVLACAALVFLFALLPTTMAKGAISVNSSNPKNTMGKGDVIYVWIDGIKDVEWTTSDESVTRITSYETGAAAVDGIKAGKVTITGTVKSTGETASCEITVKKKKGFKLRGFNSNKAMFFVSSDGKKLPKKATYTLDGKKLKVKKKDFSSDGYSVSFGKMLEDGTHTLKISQKGYTPFIYTWTYETPKYDTIIIAPSSWYTHDTYYFENGQMTKLFNGALSGKITYMIDGTPVTDYKEIITGDGNLLTYFNISGLSAGNHTMSVSAAGYADDSFTFTI